MHCFMRLKLILDNLVEEKSRKVKESEHVIFAQGEMQVQERSGTTLCDIRIVGTSLNGSVIIVCTTL